MSAWRMQNGQRVTIPEHVPAQAPPRLAVGDVVRWHSTRTAGLGQITRIDDDLVHIRSWLPARTINVTVPHHAVTPLPDLTTHVTAAPEHIR